VKIDARVAATVLIVTTAILPGKAPAQNMQPGFTINQVIAPAFPYHFVAARQEPGGWRHWFALAVDEPGAEARLLTAGEGEVEHVAASADGRWLYFTANFDDLDRRQLWRVAVAAGTPEPLTRAHGDDDRNVEFSYTVALVQLLRAEEIPFELMVFPNETRYFQVWQRWVDTFEAMDGFFERRLVPVMGRSNNKD
jgi:hypothetical protein